MVSDSFQRGKEKKGQGQGQGGVACGFDETIEEIISSYCYYHYYY